MFSRHFLIPLAGILNFALGADFPLAAMEPPRLAAPAIEADKSLPVKLSTVEGITEYRLGNGLRLLLFPDPSKPTITVNLTYLVGSRMESYGETGMAHLLEHLLFKGTPRHPNVPGTLSNLGASYNAETRRDCTSYHCTFPSSSENLERALDLEADRMVHSNLSRKDLDTEMTVVRNEFESRQNDPQQLMIEQTAASAYGWHNYGKSPIGSRSDIENVDIDRLQAFYRTYYQPDNSVLIVAGKFDEAKALERVDHFFGGLPRLSRTLQKTYTREPTQEGERLVTVRRMGDIQFAMALYHVCPASHPDFAALSVLNQVMAATPTGRLHKALLDTKQASAIISDFDGAREPGYLLLGGQVPKDIHLDTARETLLRTLEGGTASPITQEETERAKGQLLKGIQLTLNDPEELAVQLSEYIALGDWRLFFLERDRVQTVQAADVQRVLQAYIKPTNRTLGLFLPTNDLDRAVIPNAPDLDALVKDYKGKATMAPGEAFEASPANIELRTERFRTPAGLKVAMLTKKTRGESVSAFLTLHLGDLQGLMNQGVQPQLAASMLLRGTERLNRQQIQDAFDRLEAQVSIEGESDSLSVSMTTTRVNLPAVLRLVTEVLRTPAFDAGEFAKLVGEAVANLEQNRSEPATIAMRELNKHLFPLPKGHPIAKLNSDELIQQFKEAKLDGVKAYYRSFVGASSGELALVGDFDAAEIRKLVMECLGNWKSPSPFTHISRPFLPVRTVNRSIATPDKANASFIAGFCLQVQDSDPDYPALLIGNELLGGDPLGSRLSDRIRQKEGLSYYIESSLHASPLEPIALFLTVAMCAPQNVTRLEAAYREELAMTLKDGFSEEALQAAKEAWLETQKLRLSQDPELAKLITDQAYLGRTMAHLSELQAQVNALTPGQILAALRRHLDPASISIFKAGDFREKRADSHESNRSQPLS